MAEKIARLGIQRNPELLYFIRAGDVWAVARTEPGARRPAPECVARAGVEMDFTRYLYFLDGDGDIARSERQLPPAPLRRARAKKATRAPKKKTSPKKKALKKKASKKKAPKKKASKKTPSKRTRTVPATTRRPVR